MFLNFICLLHCCKCKISMYCISNKISKSKKKNYHVSLWSLLYHIIRDFDNLPSDSLIVLQLSFAFPSVSSLDCWVWCPVTLMLWKEHWAEGQKTRSGSIDLQGTQFLYLLNEDNYSHSAFITSLLWGSKDRMYLKELVRAVICTSMLSLVYSSFSVYWACGGKQCAVGTKSECVLTAW